MELSRRDKTIISMNMVRRKANISVSAKKRFRKFDRRKRNG